MSKISVNTPISDKQVAEQVLTLKAEINALKDLVEALKRRIEILEKQ